MMSILFTLLVALVFGRVFIFAIKAAWSIFKIVVSIFLIPFVLLVIFFKGLVLIAWPLLLIFAIISIIKCR